MSAAAILLLVQNLLGSLPQLIALYDKVKGGGTVTDADVQAVFAAYGIDRDATNALISAAKAAGR